MSLTHVPAPSQIEVMDPGSAGPPVAPSGADRDGTTPPTAPPTPSKRSRHLWIPAVIVVIALGGAGVWWFAIRTKPAASAAATPAVTTVKEVDTVGTGTFTDTVSAESTVAAETTDSLNFTAAGTVTAINVKAGDTVTSGEVLATMDSPALVAANDSAQATLATAKAKLTDDQAAAADDDQIRADFINVGIEYDASVKAFQALLGLQLVATTDGTVTAMNLTLGEELSSSGAGGTSQTGAA
ncbi:MAG TPA: biotin/lipoyl-binding protein, partial [Ilumatobacteraceae bacterium]